ncbi:MAG TPA: pyridoxamine 5'-phosphate oxidase family protein [Acidimicrobiales bacterium]|nr:pyridoxamine 5'-phosphate oxidase family protein [Acidimicrobiales bacterium]
MATWRQLEASDAVIASGGRALIYQVGVGLAFLGTVRKDGVARVHPVCPLLTDDRMYVFVIPSPKRNDLLRDGRYTLHSFPTDSNEDAFCVTGTASVVEDDETRARLAAQFGAERSSIGLTPADDDLLFELSIDSCFLTRTTGHGDPNPQHQHWRA